MASGAAVVALYLVGVSVWFGLADSFGGVPASALDPPLSASSYTLWNLSSAAFALSNFVAAAFVAATALSLADGRLTPDSTRWTGMAAALFLALNGCLQTRPSESDGL